MRSERQKPRLGLNYKSLVISAHDCRMEGVRDHTDRQDWETWLLAQGLADTCRSVEGLHLKETEERPQSSKKKFVTNEPRRVKICLRVFRPGSDTNRAVQPQRMARGLKFQIDEVDSYYLCRESKGTDQLRSFCVFVFAYANSWFSHDAALMVFERCYHHLVLMFCDSRIEQVPLWYPINFQIAFVL